jgi:hypothetical protein
MKAVTRRLFKCFDREQCKREIEEELRFHLRLSEEHFQLEMTLADAKAAALNRFGNVEQIKDQCFEISRRNRYSVRALRSFLILLFLLGVLVRVLSTELHVMRVGGILIAIAIASRLFLYVRGLNPSSFRPQPETTSPLMLSDNGPASIKAYDHRALTPFERVIADK